MINWILDMWDYNDELRTARRLIVSCLGATLVGAVIIVLKIVLDII